MVKVGFIGEGKTEQLILQSASFQAWLRQQSIEPVGEVIDAGGSGNLLPNRIEPLCAELFGYDAEKIIILTDLDTDASVAITQKRIGQNDKQLVLVAVQKIEAWFLADTKLMCQMTNTTVFVEKPEAVPEPFEMIRQILIEKTGKGVGTKPMLARRMIKYGFTIEKAAQHPNCPSAHYFLTKLQTLASAN